MADFIAHLIRNQKGVAFAARVAHYSQVYYARISGRQNDARIAGNHALLAAAFEQFAAYLGDVWPGWQAEVKEFAEEDLAAMVEEAVGEAEQEQQSAIFLAELRELLNYDRVWVEDLNYVDDERKPKELLIGRRVSSAPHPLFQAQDVLELSINLSLAAVQKSLRDQNKPPLAIGDQALIQQLAATGLLLDKDNRPFAADHSGVKTYQVRMEGTRMRVIRITRGALLEPETVVAKTAQPASS
jgi:hypothetical protein